MSSVTARVVRLERARAANADRVVVVVSHTDSDPDRVEREVVEGGATGATVVVINSLAPALRRN